jgi:hypothetical protein
VLRNTWAPGGYTFGSPVLAVHNETTRFDAFLLASGPAPAGGATQALLGLYTQLTGPPFMPPIYALFQGDSDCYHNDRHGNSTQVAVSVASLCACADEKGRAWPLHFLRSASALFGPFLQSGTHTHPNTQIARTTCLGAGS